MTMSKIHQQVLAFPAVKTAPAGYLPDPASINKLQIPSPSKKSEPSKKKSMLRINSFTSGARDQSKLGPKLTETVKRKLSLGAKIIQMGGLEKIYKRLFRVYEEEKLFKAYQCYLSTTAGPIAGLLFISSKKIAFCSERSIKVASPQGDNMRVHNPLKWASGCRCPAEGSLPNTLASIPAGCKHFPGPLGHSHAVLSTRDQDHCQGVEPAESLLEMALVSSLGHFGGDRTLGYQKKKNMRVHYKVSIPLCKIKGVIQSMNTKKPSQKYIEIVTVDNFDFWFMGFTSYQKAFNCLEQALSLEQ